MDDHTKTLRRVLKPGTKRLNWNSLGIRDYVLRCEQAITKFESLVNQVQKNAQDIQDRLKVIEGIKLFKQPPSKQGYELPEAKVHYTRLREILYTCTFIT